MSKLQLLAEKRRQQKEANVANNERSGLDKLLQKRKLVAQPLLNLETKKRVKEPVGGKLNKVVQPSLSLQQKLVEKDDPLIELSLPTPSLLSTTTKRLQQPTHILPSIIFANNNALSKSVIDINTNIPTNIAVKIKENFQKKSPDDNRKIVNTLSEKIQNVELKQEKEESRSSSTIKKPTKAKNKIDLNEEITLKSSKPLLSAIVIGHVDSGKSTTIGRLLYDLGIVDSRSLHKLTKDAELAGKGSFSLAWIMDQTPEERSRGVTIDIVQTQFETSNMRFAIIDSPGHRDYIPQMINGITQADVAIVIIDSTSDLIFEASSAVGKNGDFSVRDIAKGQTFEQLKIAKNLGIENVLLVINKMDVNDWDEDRFISIENVLKDHLTNELGFQLQNLNFLPASGFNGDNIFNDSKLCPWYNGPTLFQYMEIMNTQTNENSHITLSNQSKDQFVLTVTDLTLGSGIESGSIVSTSKKSDTVTIHGRVNSGYLQPGESVNFWPSNESGQVDTISTVITKVNNSKDNNNKVVEKVAIPGEFVEMKIRKVELIDALAIGDLVTKITKADDEFVKCSNQLVCELSMFSLNRPILIGTPFILFKGNVSYSAKLYAIEWVENKIENDDGSITLKKTKKRKHLSSNQRARVIIETEKLVPITESIVKLNRIVIRKEGLTVAAGLIKKTIIL